MCFYLSKLVRTCFTEDFRLKSGGCSLTIFDEVNIVNDIYGYLLYTRSVPKVESRGIKGYSPYVHCGFLAPSNVFYSSLCKKTHIRTSGEHYT